MHAERERERERARDKEPIVIKVKRRWHFTDGEAAYGADGCCSGAHGRPEGREVVRASQFISRRLSMGQVQACGLCSSLFLLSCTRAR
jgi:hypothetical protein